MAEDQKEADAIKAKVQTEEVGKTRLLAYMHLEAEILWISWSAFVCFQAEVRTQADQVAIVQADAQADLDVAMPALNKAVQVLCAHSDPNGIAFDDAHARCSCQRSNPPAARFVVCVLLLTVTPCLGA